jgi:hypothetical protein
VASDDAPEVTALAININVPAPLQWTDTRRGEEFTLTSITVRMLPDGHLAAKAYGRPTNGGKGTYVSFPVPPKPELTALINKAADQASAKWAAHQGLA